MSSNINNQLKEDAHQVYLPLVNEISKYKNLKFIVVSRFVGFDKSSFIKRKINRVIQLVYYIFFEIPKINLNEFNLEINLEDFLSLFYLVFLLDHLLKIQKEKFLRRKKQLCIQKFLRQAWN